MSRTRFLGALATIAFVAAGPACRNNPEVAKREFVRSGDGYAAEKKYNEAIIQYRNAVQQDPRFADARLKLADAYLAVGNFAAARPVPCVPPTCFRGTCTHSSERRKCCFSRGNSRMR